MQEVLSCLMRTINFSAEVSSDFVDPLADTYHVDGADAPEEMRGRRVRRGTRRDTGTKVCTTVDF